MSTPAANQHTNPIAQSWTSFGAMLVYLRRRARLRQRDLAIAVGYSEAQIGRLENDQRLPDIPIVMSQFVPALDLEDEPELARRLIELAHVARTSAGAAEEQGVAIKDAPSARSEAISPHAPSAPVHLDIPHHPTPFLGRNAELSRLEELLRATDQRCLTLMGPGGVGKTRLALEAAVSNGSHFADGVCLVALAQVASPALLAPAIAEALRLTTPRDGDVVGQLRTYLRDKHLLLVLDNLEHLVEGADQLATLLVAAPRLYLLTTSRERLQIRGEVVLDIAGLPTPPRDASGESLAGNDAVGLFLSTARRVRDDVTLTPENLQAIARICRLVEGFPLAIELAASWVRVLSPIEIEVELRQTLDFLQTSARDLAPRHRSMRGALTHSWVLLTPAEQHALCCVSVFRGDFGREAAGAVLGATAVGPSLLPLLSSLVDKSMLRRVRGAGGSRYVMHELVRQFAEEQLRSDREAERATRERHSRYYLELLCAHEAGIRGEAQHATLAVLGGEIDNLRAALDWTSAIGDVIALRRVLPVLLVFLEWRYTVLEGQALFGPLASRLQALEPPPEHRAVHKAAHALALAYSGWFTFYLGRADEAAEQLRAAQSLAEQSGDALALGDTLLFLGFILGSTGDSATGRHLLLSCMRAYEACGDGWRITRGLYRLGMLLFQDGAYVGAQQLFAVCFARLRNIGDPRATALTLNRLGVIDALLGRYDEAQAYLQQSLLHASIAHDQRGLASVLFHLGSLAQHHGDHHTARYFFEESRQIFSVLHERFSVADCLAQIGYSAAMEDAHAEARQAFGLAWQIVGDGGATPTALGVVAGNAALDLAEGRAARAAEALALVLYHPSSGQDIRDRAAHLLQRAAARLTPYQFASAQARGRSGSIGTYMP